MNEPLALVEITAIQNELKLIKSMTEVCEKRAARFAKWGDKRSALAEYRRAEALVRISTATLKYLEGNLNNQLAEIRK